MCFKNSEFCICGIPLWVGAFYIGLAEFFSAVMWIALGWPGVGTNMLGMSVWFALLFIPSIFYHEGVRKTIYVLYTIVTVISVCSLFTFTVLIHVYRYEIPTEYK